MSNKLIKPVKVDKKKEFIKGFFKYLGIFILLFFIGLFALYKYLNYTEGFTIYFSPYNIQNQYARFLIDINDDFIDKMVMFENIVKSNSKVEDYSDYEKEQLSDIIVAENSILSRLMNTAPNDANLDYQDLYDNITQSYALYIQGQLMKMEWILQTQDGMDEERYILGDSVTNLMGNFIIEYNAISNAVRETTFDCKYTVLDGLDYNLGDATASQIERDENGNIIIEDDKTYLYIPENEKTSIKENEITTEEVDEFIDDFKELQE